MCRELYCQALREEFFAHPHVHPWIGQTDTSDNTNNQLITDDMALCYMPVVSTEIELCGIWHSFRMTCVIVSIPFQLFIHAD